MVAAMLSDAPVTNCAASRVDVFQHHAQLRKALAQWLQDAVDEDLFAVEDVDVGMRDFAMHQQRHAGFAHGFQHAVDLVDGGHALRGVRGGTGRIQFDCDDLAAGLGLADFIRRSLVGEVQHHQRIKVAAGRCGRADAFTVAQCLLGAQHRRHQIRHGNGAAECTRGGRHRVLQGGAVTEVHVPVVGAEKRQLLHGQLMSG